MTLNDSFKSARLRVLGEEVVTNGVGGLGEKSVHKILKLTIEPDTSKHEVKFLGSVADIKNADGIFEIQTKNHYRLIPKLKKFLTHSRVTLVIPLIKEKRVRWIDPESGEISEPKKSPKHEGVYTAFYYLAPLASLIADPNFSVKLFLLCADEYKRLDGWDKTRKRGASKADKIPASLLEVIDLSSPIDYKQYIPKDLPERFLAKEFSKKIASPSQKAYYVIKLFESLGYIEQDGKEGRAFVYKIKDK